MVVGSVYCSVEDKDAVDESVTYSFRLFHFLTPRLFDKDGHKPNKTSFGLILGSAHGGDKAHLENELKQKERLGSAHL